VGRRWAVADIPDLRGRTAIVTGASSGIGFQTASALARRGARVILAVRSLVRGSVAAEIIRTHHTADVDVWELDLADLASVRSFATRWCEEGAALDVLINNAGTMALTRRQTADGVEVHFGVNHLGHFALTGLLMPSLSARGRVVTVSSLAHRVGRMRFDDLAGRQRVSPLAGYAQSKLANLLFTAELDRRLRASGSGASAIAAHPGFTATHIIGIGPTITAASRRQQMMSRLMSVVAQDAAMGALPVLRAAVDVSIPSGAYVGPRGWLEIRGYPREVLPASRARDGEMARELWLVSEELTGVHLT
jgi:NAD(P)-dependent dehydrogenase (short-subunit alcohol dehydrogenase family)